MSSHMESPAGKAVQGGALAFGVVGALTPVLYAKNRLQTGQKIVWQNCYRGAPLMALNVVPQAAVTFAVNELVLGFYFGKPKSELTTTEKAASAALAGASSGFLSAPGEFVVQNYQNGWKGSMDKVAIEAMGKGGIPRFFSGGMPLALREAKYAVAYLVGGEKISEYLEPLIAYELPRKVTGAALSGFCVGLLTAPSDTWRANRQWMERQWSLSQTVKEVKISGLMAGGATRAFAVAVASVIMGPGREYFFGK